MKTRTAALATAALLGALAGASGCVDNRASVQAQHVCFPSDDCTFDDTCEEYIGYPALAKTDSAYDDLWLLLQVANQMPNNEDLALGRTNTNDAHIDETVVAYEGALGGEQSIGSNFRVPAGGTSIVSVKLALDGAVAGTAAAPTELLANVRFRGYLDDGTRFETGEFPVWIKVCDTGCGGTLASLGCTGTAVCPPSSVGQLPLVCVD
jgi:hypothetical protein